MRESQMNFREESKYWVKKGSIYNCVERDASSLEKSLDEQNLFSGEEMLPNPYVTFSTNISGAHGVNKTENKEQLMCQRIHYKGLVESPQCAGRKRFNKSHFPNISWTNQVGNWETENFKNSEVKCNRSFMHKNNFNCKKGPHSWEEDFTRLYQRHSLYEEDSILASFDRHHCKNADETQKVKYDNHHFVTHSYNCLHAYPVPSVHMQQNAQWETNVWVPVQGGFQTFNGMKIRGTSHVLGRSFCDSVCSQQFSGYQVHEGYKFTNDITFETKAKKWIPVHRKERIGFAGGFYNVINGTFPFHASVYNKSFSGSGVHKESEFRKKTDSETKAKRWVPVQTVGRTGYAVVCNVFSDTSLSSCGETNDRNSNSKGPLTCGLAASSDSKSTEHIAPSTIEITSNENTAPKFENDSAMVVHASESTNGSMTEEPKGTAQSLMGSQASAETLNAAYLLQLESEKAELEMGQPLAEVERFIHSASPVISFSHSCAPCAICSVSQLSFCFLCKHQKANIPLRALWNWYEKSGNYGLEIKAVDYKRKGMLTDMVPFQAHFIPFLSAVQLFAYVRREKQELELNSSSPKTLSFKHSPEATQSGNFCVGNKTSDINLDSIEEVCISNDSLSCKPGYSPGFLSSSNCPGDSELIFEFFESELPHQRKPLHIKIDELIKAGKSNLVAGDPSKLESLDLHDLHPASWYSVAWYPSYRIPEGNFHASFLTYHSLGHLVQRCIPTKCVHKNATCIVAPVLGLESYNTQGECWFDLRIPVKTSLEEFSQCKHSEILVQRLRILEENAFHFARGSVCKNNVKVFNQQSDYEFFISRKH